MSPEESSDISEKYRLPNRPTADVQQHSNHILKLKYSLQNSLIPFLLLEHQTPVKNASTFKCKRKYFRWLLKVLAMAIASMFIF